MQNRALLVVSIFSMALPAYEGLWALPQKALVIEGDACLQPQERQLSITAGDRSIIQWDSFSIGLNEKVSFTLPSAQSAVLNRVCGESPSALLGELHANGAVYLINPHGILIGKEGVVQTASFIASTLDVSNFDFLEGKELLFRGDSEHCIENQGTIVSEQGPILLLAKQIVNDGSLLAPQGMILISAGREITYLPYGNEKIQISLKPQTKTGEEPIGILQKGLLQAKAIELKTDGNLYSYAIKNEGILEAISVENRDGHVYLVAEGGVTYHSGSIAASEVRLLGQHVRVEDDAVIDASSPQGGGSILIGGDFQGSNPDILNANTTVIGENVILSADATVKGDGGKIIVWADGATGFYGTANVNAGPEGGDGGFVEASGKDYLDFSGFVNAEALFGKRGTLLLDPTNISIAVNGGVDSAGVTFTACPTGTYAVTGAALTTIDNGLLVTRLGSTCNISISTASVSGSAGTITVAAPIVWTSDNSLTMNANSGITVSADIRNITSNTASLTLNSGTTASSTLTIGAGVTVSLVGPGVAPTGTLTLASNAVATSDMIINGAVNASGKALTILCADDFTLTAGTGSITFNSPGKIFTFTSGTAAGNLSNFNGPVTITDGNVVMMAGTLSINDAFTTAGTGTTTITTTPTFTTGAASVINYNSTGDFSATATGVGSDIVISGIFNVTGANATFSPQDDFTLTATTGIMTFSAAGKALTFNSGASTTYNFNGALNVTGGNLLVQSFDNIIIALTTGSITYDVPGGSCSFIAVGGADPDLTINGALTVNNGTLLADTFDDIIVGASGSFIYNSPDTSTLTASGPDGDITINGAMTVTDGSIIMNSTSVISSGGASSITWSSPGTWTMTTTGTNITFAGLVTVSSGSVIMNAQDDISLGAASTLTWSSPGSLTMMNAVPAVGSTIALNGLTNFTNGIWIIDSQGSISTGVGSVLNYSAPNSFSMLSHLGNVTFSGAVNLNTASSFSATATVGTCAVNQAVTNMSSGPITATSGGNFTINATTAVVPSIIGSAGGLTTISSGGSLTLSASELTAGSDATIGFSFGGQQADILIDVAGGCVMSARGNQNARINSTGALTMTVGDGLVLNSTFIGGQLGKASISASGDLTITAQDIGLLAIEGAPVTSITSSQGTMKLIAFNTTSIAENCLISNQGSGNLTIVVDQTASLPPQIGQGAFKLFGSASITTNGGELSIFTATPSQNQINGLINGATLAQGNQVFGTYFLLSGIDPPPFTIFYKTGTSENSFFQLSTASAEMTQQQMDRAMGWAWMSPFIICYGECSEEGLSRQQMLFKRKPFEYPIFFEPAQCPAKDIRPIAHDPFRYLN